MIALAPPIDSSDSVRNCVASSNSMASSRPPPPRDRHRDRHQRREHPEQRQTRDADRDERDAAMPIFQRERMIGFAILQPIASTEARGRRGNAVAAPRTASICANRA